MAERSKAAVLKTVVPQGTVGSNPTSSAIFSKNMENITIQRAEEKDWAYIQERMRKDLLDAENADWPQFFVARNGNKTLAFGRIIDHGSYFEIATMGVDYDHRRKGIGLKLLNFLVREARKKDPSKDIYGVTNRPEFVSRGGFREIEGKGPEAIEYKKYNKCKDPSKISIMKVIST